MTSWHWLAASSAAARREAVGDGADADGGGGAVGHEDILGSPEAVGVGLAFCFGGGRALGADAGAIDGTPCALEVGVASRRVGDGGAEVEAAGA